MTTRNPLFTQRPLFSGQMERRQTLGKVLSVQLNKPDSRNRIEPGDLVSRNYPILVKGYTQTGLVLERDNNGFLIIAWGSKIENMWDDYDLMRIE